MTTKTKYQIGEFFDEFYRDLNAPEDDSRKFEMQAIYYTGAAVMLEIILNIKDLGLSKELENEMIRDCMLEIESLDRPKFN